MKWPQNREEHIEALLGEHPRAQIGMWEILGADQNTDLGGPHHMPRLEVVEGIYEEAVRHAVGLRDFWAWSWPGKVQPIKAKKLGQPGAGGEEVGA